MVPNTGVTDKAAGQPAGSQPATPKAKRQAHKQQLQQAIKQNRQAVLVVNTHSRKGAALYKTAKELLQAQGITLTASYAIRSGKYINQVVTKALASKPDLLIVGSGDGTVAEVVDHLAYSKTYPNATEGVIQKDWITVAAEWARAISLDAGKADGQSSNARLLTQLIPTEQRLNPSLPSIAEALAVLAGCTLLTSSLDSPFIHFWNYSTTVSTLKEPQHQAFQATLRTKDFASGPNQPWQQMFYVVLFFTFATNSFCLVYFLVRHGLVTDFIEPQNLFSLSLNSPPSHALDGACGSGPENEQLLTSWHIKMDQEREHFYIENGQRPPTKRKTTRPLDFEMDTSPIVNTYTKLSSRHTSLL